MIVRSALRLAAWLALVLLLMLAGPLLTLAFGKVSFHGDWRFATHRAAGLAPDPLSHPEAIVQAYASRTFGWRGAFAVHTWIAAKPAHADRYTRYEVIGWRAHQGSGLSVSETDAPDSEWYGAAPRLIGDVRGAAAEGVIAKLPDAAASYPHTRYSAWPGPNSNTFIAHLGRAIPELHLTLPVLAIGKDYLAPGEWIARTPSGTGYQFSAGGLIGVTAARDEGLEINLFGLVTGIDFHEPAIKVPGIGSVPAHG
jgi:hypothetical protein